MPVSYNPSRAEPPDPYESYYQRQPRPAGDRRYEPVPRPRGHHESARQLPESHASHRRGSRQWDEYPEATTLRVAGRAGTRDRYDSPAARRSGHAQNRGDTAAMSAVASFWYVLGCIAMGGMYLAKVPCKKALEEAGLATMTSAERFWYVLGCLPLGAFYFCKLPVKKALTETTWR